MVNKNKLAFKLLQEWPFQTNAVLLKFLFIKELKKKSVMVSTKRIMAVENAGLPSQE